jgi:hypothetical protein
MTMTEPSSQRPVPGPPRPAPSAPAGAPEAPTPERPAADRFGDLDQRPVAEHVAAYEAEHERLQRELGTIDQL